MPLGVFLDVFDALATAGEGKGDAVVGLARNFGAGAGREGESDDQGREQGAKGAVHRGLAGTIVECR